MSLDDSGCQWQTFELLMFRSTVYRPCTVGRNHTWDVWKFVVFQRKISSYREFVTHPGVLSG